jgi:DNA-binding NtrC family response regulator
MKSVLIIDDDPVVTTLLRNLLEKSGYQAITASNGEEGLRLTRIKSPDLVITDFEMPGMSGLEVVKELCSQAPGLPVIMLTCHSDVSLTIKSIQAGAYDYIEKPIQPKKMLEAIRNGIQVTEQSRKIEEKVPIQVRKILEDNILAGKSQRIREIVKNIGRISTTRMPVLIHGESGTGKTEVANLIHYSGITRDAPIVTLHCDTMRHEMVEETLIGYHSDAYERKRRTREGLLVRAGEGSMVIFEFHLLPLPTQLTLSRILEQQLIQIPGHPEPIPFKARIIAAIGSDPEVMLKEGKILPELYYRLKVFNLQLPPLRLRSDDIEELTAFYLEKQNRKLAKNVKRLEQGTLELLLAYPWPGNLRELENTISQAIILSRGDVLEKEHVRMYLQKEELPSAGLSMSGTLEDMERVYIRKVLEEVAWRKGDAANILGITRPTLNAKIERFKLREQEEE